MEQKLDALREQVLAAFGVISSFVVFVAWMLSKLFMRPVHQRVTQIEQFIDDVTHELNTPITSLSMSTKLALEDVECNNKILKNISISTKQLYDIYRSLTYLNFSNKKEPSKRLDLKNILEKNIAYYTPLAEMKHITFEVALESFLFTIPEAQATLLFGNLISNAIKYSCTKSKIVITLKDGIIHITDEGIGIKETQQEMIFKKFKRATTYSGGFGIGLSIVKSICDEYGIDVSIYSEVTKGTTFRLSFL